jgi:hypothetical protein
MSDLLLTYRGAVYPWHCDQSMLTGAHMDAEARKACPFPQEILAHGKSLVREYTPPA